MIRARVVAWLTPFILLAGSGNSFAWHDQTHLAVSRAAGYERWYNSAGADIAKEKAHRVEEYNHWFNNNRRAEISPQLVMGQVERYNDPSDPEGHLYGAIIASLQDYREGRAAGKYAEYPLAYCAHYIGDLSQPLHNIPYNAFNKLHHMMNDGIVEREVLSRGGLNELKRHMYRISLRREFLDEDLSREIARIANVTRRLGYRLEAENRNMTKEEAYTQLGHSASLLQAVLASVQPEQRHREPQQLP
jgi:hypothetical protein